MARDHSENFFPSHICIVHYAHCFVSIIRINGAINNSYVSPCGVIQSHAPLNILCFPSRQFFDYIFNITRRT